MNLTSPTLEDRQRGGNISGRFIKKAKSWVIWGRSALPAWHCDHRTKEAAHLNCQQPIKSSIRIGSRLIRLPVAW
jgi:hypothetical protein